MSYKLTAGSFARCELTLDAAVRACGRTLRPRQIVVNPDNSTADVSYFPLTEVLAAVGVDKLEAAIVVMGSANADMECRLAGRAFNDPSAPGSWTDLETGWNTPGSGDSERNTGEVALTRIAHAMRVSLVVGALRLRVLLAQPAPGRCAPCRGQARRTLRLRRTARVSREKRGPTGLSLSSYQWFQAALAVRKSDAGDANSRALFRVIPAFTYT